MYDVNSRSLSIEKVGGNCCFSKARSLCFREVTCHCRAAGGQKCIILKGQQSRCADLESSDIIPTQSAEKHPF